MYIEVRLNGLAGELCQTQAESGSLLADLKVIWEEKLFVGLLALHAVR